MNWYMEKLKEFVKKNQNAILTCILISTIMLQVLLHILYGIEKPYFHIDEGYSYGLMNYDKVDIMNNDDFYNTWHTKDYYMDYFSISSEEEGDFSPVYENQKNDVHPPFYYLILRIASMFTINSFSKWTGIIPNIIIFIITSVFVYLIATKIFKNKIYGVFIVLVNGFTLASIDTTIFIRMYALNALNLLIIAYLHMINFNKKELSIKDLGIMSIFIIIGSLTHYYYLVFLFMLFVIYILKFIKERNIKNIVKYVVMMGISACISLAIFPYSFVHMFMGYRGVGAISNLEKLEGMWNSLGRYIGILNNNTFNGALIVILIVVAMMAIYKIAKNKKIILKFESKEFWLVFLPTICYFLIVALVSPYQELRYIMPICPLMVIGVFYLFKVALEKVFSSKNTYIALTITFILMLILQKTVYLPFFYLYKDKKEIVSKMEEEHSRPCLYIFNTSQNRFLDDIYMFTKIDNSYILDSSLFNEAKVREIFENIDIENGITVFINGGLNNDSCLDILTKELNCASYKWIQRMNACDIYLINVK